MKNVFALFGLFLLFGALTQSCIDDSCTEKQKVTVYNPVYLGIDEVRAAVKAGPISEPESTGALYYYNDFLFIGEPGVGIHIYNNSEKKNPKNIATIEAKGNQSMAIKSDMLYIDNYMDLFVFDLSNMAQPQMVKRIDNVFIDHQILRDENVVIDYVAHEEEIEFDCNSGQFIDFVIGNDVLIDFGGWSGSGNGIQNASLDQISIAAPEASSGSRQVGIGGSLARFTIAFDRLYVVESSSMKVFSLDKADCPESVSTINLGFGIETIFPYKENLFIGSQTGMLIYSASDRDNPTLLGRVNHATVCDPVFVTDDRAYVTLRDGQNCRGFVNQLDVINITDLTRPRLVTSYNMDNPHGLSVRDEILYICDGDSGLKVFDRSNDFEIDQNQLEHIKNISAIDVISLSKDHLLMIGKDGLHQYDSSDPSDLEELSFISINK